MLGSYRYGNEISSFIQDEDRACCLGPVGFPEELNRMDLVVSEL
jgi:hypothetical protein